MKWILVWSATSYLLICLQLKLFSLDAAAVLLPYWPCITMVLSAWWPACFHAGRALEFVRNTSYLSGKGKR